MSKTIIIEDIEREQKVLSLYASSIYELLFSAIPSQQYDGWVADIGSSQVCVPYNDWSKMIEYNPKSYMITFRRTRLKLK